MMKELNLNRTFYILSVFFLLFFLFTPVFCEETPKVEKADTYHNNCREYSESLSRYVKKARIRITEGKYKSAVGYYKKHLKCWNDKNIFVELGDLHANSGKDYLASIAYKNGNDLKKYKQLEKNALKNLDSSKTFFRALSSKKQAAYLKKSNTLREMSIVFMTIGSVAAVTGFSLFIHQMAGGTNSSGAQFFLMFGGLSLLNAGIFSHAMSDYRFNMSNAFGRAPELYMENFSTTPKEYYKYSGLESKTKKLTRKAFLKSGIALLFMSIPLFFVPVYGYKLSAQSVIENSDCQGLGCIGAGFGLMALHLVQIVTFAPAIASLVGGIIMLAKTSKWSTLKEKETLFTLKSVSPMINPVTKTYGISMGFSF